MTYPQLGKNTFRLEDRAGRLCIETANGIAYVYSRETNDASNIAGVLTEDEARRQ